MKIEILNPNSPYGVAFTLMAGAAQSPEHARMEAQCLTDLQEGLRAVDAGVFNRGNMQHRQEFTSTRSYNTIGEAETALLDFPYTVPTSGIIKYTPEGAAGSGVRYQRNATVSAFGALQNGTTIIWTFTIVGGGLSAIPPP